NTLATILLLAIVSLLLSPLGFAQPPAETETPAETPQAQPLDETQQAIFARYQRFSKTLTQLYGYMKETDPARAELLLRVIGKSNESRIDNQMEVLLQLLGEDTPQFAGIVDRQNDLIESLANLLDVLQSENELARLGEEIARLEELVENLTQLVADQKQVRSGTERGKPTESLEQEQSDVTRDAEKLAEKIEQQDKQRQQEAEQESGEQKPSDQKPSEQQPQDPSQPPNESQPQDGQSSPMPKDPSDQKPNEQKPSEQKPNGEQPPMPQDSQEKPSEQNGDSQEQQQQQNKPEETPGKEELESAIEKMQKAIEELKEKKRDDAAEDQDRAIAELEKAKARLEEILRQLREEEQKIMLAALEARFRKMLQMQLAVRKGSGPIADLTDDQRQPRHRARSVQLARDEQDIIVEADKALLILQEEGTSVAFPEAVLGLREDMRIVTDRLNRFEVDELTIAIEDDIIEALEEMVEALRKELEKIEQQQQQQQNQQQNQEQDQALVDLIAELKLLRSLQYRVNRRTKQYGRQIDGEQATDPELQKLLQELSVRQARIHRATYDLSIGKNQ
ncbi:MAG: hypothetical protein KDA78_18260, partial [Planctomycetaceae bacterium]|nr:hypothetical protein [Planctomycetaceae bacterium]